MKKALALVLSFAMISLSGCGGAASGTAKPATTTEAATSTSKAAAASTAGKAETSKAAASGASSGAKVVLRLAESQSDTYPSTMGAIKFADLVKERTGGRVEIQVFTGGQLGSDEQAIIEQVQFGAIDLTRVNLAPMTEFAPMLNLFQMPFLFTNSDHMHKVIDSDLGAKILSTLDEKNFKGLALYDAGTRNFYNSKHPITKLSDLKGMKIRTTQSQLIVDMVQALGAVPTPMAFGEVYSSLQTGVIDGAENNWVSYDQNSHYEVAKYFTPDGHTAPPEVMICSKIVFDKLSADDQKILVQAAKDSVVYEREQYSKAEQKSIDKVKAAGCVISELENRSEFEKAVEPLYDKYAGNYKQELEQIKSMR